jgi:hypothetical protein
MIGINGTPWFDLEPYLDLDALEKQKHLIAMGLTLANNLRAPTVGTQGIFYDQSMIELGDFAKNVMEDPNYEYKQILPILRTRGNVRMFCKYMYPTVALNDAIHLNTVKGGLDYANKHLKAECEDTPAFKYFEFLRKWINDQNIFKEWGRVIFFINEPGVQVVKHRDYPSGRSRRDNMMWISLDKRKNFWIWDEETDTKHYTTSRGLIFDNADWHGVDPTEYMGWSLRVDGVYTDEFLEKSGLRDWFSNE